MESTLTTSLMAYLTGLQDISEQTKEHTNRPELKNLLENLAQILSSQSSECKNIRIIHEPLNDKEGKGAPDFLITKDSLVLGYVENKRVNAKLDEIAQSSQIQKYFTLSPNIILTDYLRFCLLRQDDKGAIHIERECKICELGELKAIAKNPKLCDLDSKARELTELFALFFTRTPKPINTAKELASILALYTKILKNKLESNQHNAYMQALHKTFTKALYKKLEFSEFADSFTQTLTYSLFLSRLNNTTGKDIDLDNAYNFIPKSFPLIKAMGEELRELKKLDSAEWVLEAIVNIVNHIDVAKMIRDLNKAVQRDLLGEYMHKDPYLHFYEDFLESYDSSLRKRRGVYYTPAPVVEFIIDSIDLLLQKDFKKQGLKAAMSDESITLLDFAAGTGTFLLQAFRKALESTPKNSAKYDPKALIKRFHGFEYLITPYVVAHLRISQAFKEDFKQALRDDESLSIMLTNTLLEFNDKEPTLPGLGEIELTKEFKKAQDIKNSPNILIITGNPPYSGASANKGDYEKEVQEAYKIPMEMPANPTAIIKNGKVEKEKNPKWLLDDYVKFIRFAERKIENQGGGIFAFISNNGFLDNPTFRGMRYHLLNTFDTIYILDLHGSTRKKESAPNGEKDENVFDIQQGVSINIFVKSSPNTENLATIYHYDLYGNYKDKYRFLKETSLDSIPWQTLKPQAPFYLFIPQDENLRAEYDKGFSVKDIFRVSGVGICSKRDSIVFHNSKEKLKAMLHDFITKPQETLRKEYKIGEDSRDWKLESAIESIKENKDNLEDFIRRCHYRPFDYRYTYYINKSRAFMAYPVYDIFQHFLEDFENIGISIPRQLKDAGREWNHCMMTDSITDQALTSGGNGAGAIHPLYIKNPHTNGGGGGVIPKVSHTPKLAK